MLELNLPEFDYKITKKEGRLFIWDIIRSKYIALTPEEWVRQHFIHYLVRHKNISPALIAVETGREYNGRAKRCDIVVWNTTGNQELIVECKASHVPLSENTTFQLGSYNAKTMAPFLALTNGINHFYFTRNGENYSRIEELPEMVSGG